MDKICKKCGINFSVRDEDLEFLKKISPVIKGKKYDIPSPTFCADCRQQRRLCWRNERNLYKRKCDATGEDVVSNISPDKPFKVYKKDYWFSDKWNPLDYGRDFDFSKTFSENFMKLQQDVPRFSIQQQLPMENSQYCNCASNCKDSYFLFDSDYCEDSLYSNVLKKSRDCCDCSFVTNSELCYESINCKDCYNLKFSQNCQNCSDSLFLESCIGCKNCALSTNLKNKQYYFTNKKFSKEEYEKKISELEVDKYPNLMKYSDYFHNFILNQPCKFMQGVQNENVSGDYISNSKNIYKSYNVEECWDVAYSELLFRAKNCIDVSSFGENIELIYECIAAGLNTQRCAFCFTPVVGSNDLYYCDTAYSSKNCFGCVGMNRNQYCIFNKQYSKDEYHEVIAKIIGHMAETGEWGEFFPTFLSPVAYNESVANDYFPLSKDQALNEKFKWKEKDKKDYKPQTVEIPENIDDVNESILKEILACEKCKKNYRIVDLELKLYKQLHLPIPQKCPDCRNTDRVKLKNPRKLWERKCSKCECKIVTSFSPERKEKVYCEKCYLDEVI